MQISEDIPKAQVMEPDNAKSAPAVLYVEGAEAPAKLYGDAEANVMIIIHFD